MNKTVELMNNPNWVALYRAVTLGLLGAVTWYYIAADAAMKEAVSGLREQNELTRQRISEAVNTNNLQGQIIDVIIDRINDHEARIRSVENWRGFVNNRLEQVE